MTVLLGSAFEISVSKRPGTRTRPGSLISALKEDLAEVSRSDADNVTSFCASITIPNSAVIMGRVERLRDTQLTESVSAALSTENFMIMSLSFWFVDEVRSQTFLYI